MDHPSHVVIFLFPEQIPSDFSLTEFLLWQEWPTEWCKGYIYVSPFFLLFFKTVFWIELKPRASVCGECTGLWYNLMTQRLLWERWEELKNGVRDDTAWYFLYISFYTVCFLFLTWERLTTYVIWNLIMEYVGCLLNFVFWSAVLYIICK